MGKALYFEDIVDGMEVPTLRKQTTAVQLVRYAGAEEDFFEFHINEPYARKLGMPRQIDQGFLKNAFLAQLMTDWIGIEGRLKKLACQYRRPSYPDQPSLCKGKVTRKYEQDGQFLVDCDVWIEDGEGKVHTSGTATVALPSREALIRRIEEGAPD
ncbi:MAG: hypothetical protein M1380_01645 [Chloroflexi bacterium]|nr:hypothetical protein [Chloroflexota bacterium]MCL5025104.1 hypothetical protein [Chloroflexota bacterium]